MVRTLSRLLPRGSPAQGENAGNLRGLKEAIDHFEIIFVRPGRVYWAHEKINDARLVVQRMRAGKYVPRAEVNEAARLLVHLGYPGVLLRQEPHQIGVP